MADEQYLSEWQPARPGLTWLGKGLAGVSNFMGAPFGHPNPPGAILSDLIGLPAAAKLLEKLGYGDRLTTGSGQTLKPAEDVVEGAMALAPPLSKGLAAGYKAASKLPTVLDSAPASLLGGFAAAKDDPGLWLSHGGRQNQMINNKGELIRELYNPSFAITRDKLSTFDSANTVIVPWPDKLDPKNAKTLLTTTDSYNPRWHASKAARVDNLPYDVRGAFERGLADPDVAAFVNQRLFEKLGSPFPKQGIKQEGYGSAPRGALPRLQQGLASFQDRWDPVASSEDWFSNRVLMSPRFQSLESFAQSPYGGKLIGSQSGSNQLWGVEQKADELLGGLLHQTPSGELRPLSRSSLATSPSTLKALASDTDPSQLLSRKKSGTFLDQLQIYDKALGANRPMTSEERAQVRRTAGELLQKMKTAPSDYAELKSYGPWQVSQDNVAGIVGRSGGDNAIAEAAKKRGIPYEPADNAADEVEAAKWFLDRKGKTSVLTRGLAGDMSRIASQPSQVAGDYASSVEKVKSTFKALQASPGDQAAFADFKKAADNFKMDSDLFVGGQKITNNEATAMQKWLDKKLQEHAPDMVIPPVAPTTPVDPNAISTSFPGVSNWLVKEASLKNHLNGEFDYLPPTNINQLKNYAADYGHKDLASALNNYEVAVNLDKNHDENLAKVLTEWDKVKDFNLGKPTPPSLATGMAKPAVAPPGGISPAGLDNMVKFATKELPWNQSSKDWFTKGQFKAEFPSLTDEQAHALGDISFSHYMQGKHGGSWADEIPAHIKILKGEK